MVGDGKPRVSGHIADRAVLKREEVPAHLWDDDGTVRGGEKTHLVAYPLRHGELFNLVVVFHSDKYDEGRNTFGDTAEQDERFAQAVPRLKELLGKIETWKIWVLRELRNQMLQRGAESAGFAGHKWMYDGIDPSRLFNGRSSPRAPAPGRRNQHTATRHHLVQSLRDHVSCPILARYRYNASRLQRLS